MVSNEVVLSRLATQTHRAVKNSHYLLAKHST